MLSMRSAVLTMLLAVVGAADLWAAGDPEIGRAIAERWCASCHVIAPEGSGSDAAPAFPAIAADPGRTAPGLRAFLTEPHFPMPNPQLSRSEIDHIVAYIESLGPQ